MPETTVYQALEVYGKREFADYPIRLRIPTRLELFRGPGRAECQILDRETPELGTFQVGGLMATGGIRRLFTRLTEAAKGFLRREKPHAEPPPSMIGTPPSQRPMWHKPAAHAMDFAERYT